LEFAYTKLKAKSPSFDKSYQLKKIVAVQIQTSVSTLFSHINTKIEVMKKI